MAIKPYDKDGQTCYLIKCTAKGKVKGSEVRRQKDLGAVTLSDARRQHRLLQQQVKELSMEKENKSLSWKEMLELWYQKEVFNTIKKSRTLLDSYNTLLKYTKDWFDKGVDEINPMDFKLIVHDMVEQQGLSRSRVKAVRAGINKVYEWALMSRTIKPSFLKPTLGVTLPKVSSKKQPILNRAEIKFLLQKAKELDHEYYYVWAVALSTGCRSGELWALKWSDVDFDRKIISITKSYSQKLNIVKDTKTNEWRDIPISNQLEVLLKELKLVTGSSGYVLPRITSWRRGNASQVLRSFCSSIGIREINLHATRACFAVQCLESGVDVATTMKLGGWLSMKSFQHYIRLAGIEVRGATDKLDLIPENKQEGKLIAMQVF